MRGQQRAGLPDIKWKLSHATETLSDLLIIALDLLRKDLQGDLIDASRELLDSRGREPTDVNCPALSAGQEVAGAVPTKLGAMCARSTAAKDDHASAESSLVTCPALSAGAVTTKRGAMGTCSTAAQDDHALALPKRTVPLDSKQQEPSAKKTRLQSDEDTGSETD